NAESKAEASNSCYNHQLTDEIMRNLSIKPKYGNNKIALNQTQTFPSRSLYPGQVNYSNFGSRSSQSLIIEPKLNYKMRLGEGSIQALFGGTFQSLSSISKLVRASEFSSENLMENISSANRLDDVNNNFNEYSYVSGYGRIYRSEERRVGKEWRARGTPRVHDNSDRVWG